MRKNELCVCACMHLCMCEFLLNLVFKVSELYVLNIKKILSFKVCWYSHAVAMFKLSSLISIFCDSLFLGYDSIGKIIAHMDDM